MVPLAFVSVTTFSAGFLNITDNFLPMTDNPATRFQGYLNSLLTVIIMLCAAIILIDSAKTLVSHPGEERILYQRASGLCPEREKRPAGIRVLLMCRRELPPSVTREAVWRCANLIFRTSGKLKSSKKFRIMGAVK